MIFINILRLYRLIKGNRLLYVGAIIATAIATLTTMLPPLIIKLTVDSVVGGKPIDIWKPINDMIEYFGGRNSLIKHLWLLSLIYVLITAVNCVFSYIKARWIAIASENVAKKLKDNLYDHLQKLPYEYHVKAQTGDLIQRCTSDVDTIRRFSSNQISEIARTIFIVFFSLFFMFRLNVPLTLFSMLIVPFIFVLSFVFFKRISKQFKLCDEKEGELSTVLQENLSGVRVVKAFGRQNFEMDKFGKRNNDYRDLCIKLVTTLAYYWSVSDALCFTQIAIVLISGTTMAASGDLSLGTLIVFMSYEGMLIWPVRRLGNILSDLGKTSVALNRVYEVLNTPEEKETENCVQPNLKGDIVFKNVSFEYEDGKKILDDMSFEVKKGETIAILGSTGSGKSTIMHLLLRLYDYRQGSIQIGGVELSSIEKKWLRTHIGLVLQEPFLYSKTIKNNIRMARFDATDEDIYSATSTAAVHDVINEFEKGYDTIVGERGVTLSGGQRQRVAIARTLIKNSSVLVFDDSLSAVDTETDAQIRRELQNKGKDVTTFIISQRITTLMEADKIFVIEHGKLAASGTHEELIARDGLYSRIWKIQTMLEDSFEDEFTTDAVVV